MRRSLVVVLSLLVGIVAGGTVLASPVAQAAQAILQVRVVNTASEPIPVSGTVQVDPTVPEPYQYFELFNQTATDCTEFVCKATFPAVPAGKRLVITYASARYALTSGGQAPSVAVGVNGNDASDAQILLTAPVRIGFDTYIASAPITFYAEAGDVPTISLSGQFVLPVSNTAQVSIVGHLIPVP